MIFGNDHHGRAITEEEPPEKTILVWVITPGAGGFDENWIRGYQDAVDFAQERLHQIVDDLSESDALSEGASVKMKLRKTTVAEYQEVQANEE